MNVSPSVLLLDCFAAAALIFAGLFFVAQRMNNFGIVDIGWAMGFAPVAGFYAWFADGTVLRRTVIAIMAGVWSVRLGGYLARRVLRQHPVEDARYQQLRSDWAGRLKLKMFLFFEAQAALLVLLSVPFLFAANNADPSWHAVETMGVVLWCVALVGETIADAQLAWFRRNPANKGRVCDVGLWRLSRHPNYFFEWLVWVGFALCASAAPGGWLSFYCPALMLYFLVKVTGIRYTEQQLVRSKGDAYRAYQERTSAFVPWFPSAPRALSDRSKR